MGRRLQRERRKKRPIQVTILIVMNGARTEKEYLGRLKRLVPRNAGLAIPLRSESGKEPETILNDDAPHPSSARSAGPIKSPGQSRAPPCGNTPITASPRGMTAPEATELILKQAELFGAAAEA